MNKKYATIGFITSALLITIGSTAILAADETANNSLEAGATQTAAPASTATPVPATTEPANTATPALATTEPASTATPAPATTEPASTAIPAPATTEPASTATPAPATTEPASTAAPAPATTEPASTATPAPAPTEPASTAAPVAEPAAKIDSTKKTLAKTTCEDFLGFDELIQAKYLIAAEAYTKGGKPKNIVIDVVASEALVPVLIEECGKTPKDSFLTKLKSKLKR